MRRRVCGAVRPEGFRGAAADNKRRAHGGGGARRAGCGYVDADDDRGPPRLDRRPAGAARRDAAEAAPALVDGRAAPILRRAVTRGAVRLEALRRRAARQRRQRAEPARDRPPCRRGRAAERRGRRRAGDAGAVRRLGRAGCGPARQEGHGDVARRRPADGQRARGAARGPAREPRGPRERAARAGDAGHRQGQGALRRGGAARSFDAGAASRVLRARDPRFEDDLCHV